MQVMARQRRFVSMDLVEVNPDLTDVERAGGLHGDNPLIKGTQTVQIAIETAISALGKSFL